MTGRQRQWGWVCDACRQPIQQPEHGVVEWLDPPSRPPAPRGGYAVQIVHYPSYSPPGRKCRYGATEDLGRGRDGVGDRPLTDFLGTDGLALLLRMLVTGRLEAGAAQELFMRVRLLIFEQVRAHLRAAIDARAPGPDRKERYAKFEEISQVLDRLTSDHGPDGSVVLPHLGRSPDTDP